MCIGNGKKFTAIKDPKTLGLDVVSYPLMTLNTHDLLMSALRIPPHRVLYDAFSVELPPKRRTGGNAIVSCQTPIHWGVHM